MKIPVKIKSWIDASVLFEAKVEVNDERWAVRAALEIAVKARASLVGASLDGASLSGARLAGASLVGARLDGARLDGARLDGARLVGASLDGASLTGERPIFQIGPIGSRCAYFVAYLTDKGIRLQTGCFFGTIEQFHRNLQKTHAVDDKANIHCQEYMAALALIEKHAELWGIQEQTQPALEGGDGGNIESAPGEEQEGTIADAD